MSLWVQLTFKDLAKPDSESRAGLVNLERAQWIESYDDKGSGSVLHFASEKTVTVTETLEEIVDLLDEGELTDEDFEDEEED